MHGGTRRTWPVGFAVAALMAAITGVAGCSSDSGKAGKEDDGGRSESARPVAAARACAHGTFTWFNIEQTQRLTGVAAVEKLGKGGGTLKNKAARLYTPETSVRAEGPTLAPAKVLVSLGKEIGIADDWADDENAFTDVGRKAPEVNDGSAAMDGSGEFVQYTGVKAVEADFRYSCTGGASTVGHAESWKGDITGVLECHQPVGGNALATAAAHLSCDEDSVAAKSAKKA